MECLSFIRALTLLTNPCLRVPRVIYRTYATTWQWSGAVGLERSEAEHLAWGPTPFLLGGGLKVRHAV